MQTNFKNIYLNVNQNFSISKFIKKNLNISFLIFITAILLLSLYISNNIANELKIKEETFRVHVVANSDSYEDQLIKCIIADDISYYLDNTLNIDTLSTKEEVINLLKTNNDDILTLVNSTLKEMNLNYSSTINIGSIYYDEKKESLNYTMNEGVYDSLEIVLGSGNGKNFWNLVFPNENNIEKLKALENILPGISNIYENEKSEIENINITEENISIVDLDIANFFNTLF